MADNTGGRNFSGFCCCCSEEGERRPLEPGNNSQQWGTTGAPTPDIIHNEPQPTSRNNDQQRGADPSKEDEIQDQQKQQERTTSKVTYETNPSFEEKMRQIEKIMKRISPKNLKIGIFSRSIEDEYQWLKTRLESIPSLTVRPCLITNNGYQKFSDDVSWCEFGILYHSKNRGRNNITDVTDSLYDEELEDLFKKLGKNNVIVVIDDLTDTSEEEKTRILTTQPSLQKWAQDVFLFSTDEKK